MYLPRKSAVALAVAATFAGGAFTTASAGTASTTYNTYATEAFSAGQVKTVANPNLAYQPKQVVAPNTTFTIYIKLNNGAKWNSGAASSITNNNTSYKSTNSATFQSVSFNQNGNVLAITFKAGSSGINQQAVFSLSQVNTLLDLSNANPLSKSGGKVTAEFAFSNGAASSPATYPSSPIDSARGTIAKSQQAIQAKFVSSGNKSGFTSSPVGAPQSERAKIDVNASTPLSDVVDTLFQSYSLTSNVSPNYVDFGAFYFIDTPGTQLNGKGNGTDYTFHGSNSTTTITNLKAAIKGNFIAKSGQEKLYLYSTPKCTGGNIYGGKMKPTSGRSKDKIHFKPSSRSISAKNSGSGITPLYVCMEVNTANGTAKLPATQPSIYPLKLQNSGTTVDTFKSNSLYHLVPNGAAINLINYVPAAAKPYTTYIRVANNSSVKAPVKVTFTGKNGNKLGSGMLDTLPAGGSRTYSASKVEKAAGVNLGAKQRPQVLVTAAAPTKGLANGAYYRYIGTSKTQLTVQDYLSNGNGNFTNMSSDKTTFTYQ